MCKVTYVADGSPLSWSDIKADLPQHYQLLAEQPNAKWTFIAQMDHPHLHRPWYMLHPCQTAELLGLMVLQEGATSYNQEHPTDQDLCRFMTAWFTLVGPVLHLHLGVKQALM